MVADGTGLRTRQSLGAVVVVGAAIILASCGVPTGGGPHAISRNQVPFRLLTNEPPTTTTTAPALDDVPVTVYFISQPDQHLVPAERAVPTAFTLRTVVDALLTGPTNVERTEGYHSALSSAVRLLRTKPAKPTPSTTTVTLDFNQAFGQISGTQQVLAVAQVVYTVTAELGAQVGVQFQIDGADIDVPTDTGAESSGPVLRKQYQSVAPLGGSTPPTAGASG